MLQSALQSVLQCVAVSSHMFPPHIVLVAGCVAERCSLLQSALQSALQCQVCSKATRQYSGNRTHSLYFVCVNI